MIAGRRIAGHRIAAPTWRGTTVPAPNDGITYFPFVRYPHGIGGIMVAGRHYVLPLAGEILDQNEAHNHVRFRQAWERRIEDDDEEIMAILMAFVGTRQ